ncbi:MAG: AAA family ATPase [Armatimonadetes bacterium]|nr:AAA family ATPase [Armatimonadota bacterium]
MIHPSPVREQQITDDLQHLLQVLPPDIRLAVEADGEQDQLLEIVLDLGRLPEARFPNRWIYLTDRLVDHNDLGYVVSRVGEFGKDNRAGIERTLHRISAIRNRAGRVVGLTCRIGRAVYGTIDIMRDVVETGKSILMLGRPGVGKTTKCREIARVLSEEFDKRVVVVDTSNEIAGDGDIPHPGIGRARRMQVPEPRLQHAVMIEAVENHMPEVIVIDEISTQEEAFAARTIAERGVQLIGTAHGNTLDNLLMNPTLSDLVGGIQAVTLSDEEAKRRGTQKTVLERRGPPTFDIVIEILEKDKMAIHLDVAKTVDEMLRGRAPQPEIRERRLDGEVEILQLPDETVNVPPPTLRFEREQAERQREHPELPATVRVCPYGVSRSRLEKAIRDLRVPALLTKNWDEADAIIALKAHYRREPGRLRDAIEHNKPTFVVRSNTQVQIEGVLKEMFGLQDVSEEEMALREAREAIERVIDYGEPVELMPQNAYIRRLQHQIAEQYNLVSASVGAEPRRRVRIAKG